ncbi:hypothetical protein B0H14DRAFT_3517623 [Mycena olivaceomarginata]|nr:hypothetical protein B0H14DRAFT_3517623 [Mycena olivaceomarginata]
MAPRASSKMILDSISTLAAQDLVSSDDEMHITLVGSTGDEEEEYHNPDWHAFETDSHDENSGAEEDIDEDDNEEESDDDDSGSDSDDDSVIVPTKRKRKEKAVPEPSPREIQYTTSVYTFEQTKKSKSSRGSPISDVFTFSSDKPWNTLKSCIRTNIRTALHLEMFSIGDYTVTFTVPRQVTESIPLTDYKKYRILVSNALKIKGTPSAKIKWYISRLHRKCSLILFQASKQKENNVHKERDILPANVALNAKIGALRERWMCPTPNGQCGSEHCFVHPDEADHFALSHAHMESWAAAILKGEQFATINKPPNNTLFDRISPQSLAARSPLIACRAALNANANAPPAPQINFNFPPEILGLFFGNAHGAAPAPAHAPAPAPATVPAHPTNSVPMLLPFGIVPGPSLTIEAFCTQYQLDDDICTRFRQHKFKKTDSFAYIAFSQLTTMEFMAGEVAELQAAVAQWAQPSV